MDTGTLSNLMAYSVQVGCVALAASPLPALLRIDAPGVRYAYWRAVMALCLVLPWLQPRHPFSTVAVSDTAGAGSVAAVAGAPVAVSSPDILFSLAPIVAVGLGVGAAVRLVWLGVGLVRLRRLRHTGHIVTSCELHDELQRIIGTRAEIRYVPDMSQPVTFGIRPAVVLLPLSLQDQPVEIQRAVLGHELFHVQRRDWAWLLAEEVVRAALWFHPAVWWLISRVQLAREEVVDELSVLLTGRRRTYVEALMTFVDDTPLAPTAAFARRRHLFLRMMLISKEAVMSSNRIVVSGAVMALVVAAGSWYAVGAFPLRQAASAAAAVPAQTGAPGPLERRAHPITPENPIPRRIAFVAPLFPDTVTSGRVGVKVTLDDAGRVAESRITLVAIKGNGFSVGLTGNELGAWRGEAKSTALAMRPAVEGVVSAALSAVNQWRYDPPFNAPVSFALTLEIGAPPPPPPPPARRGRTTPGVESTPPPPPPPPVGLADEQFSWGAEGTLRVGGEIKAPRKTRHVPPDYPPIAQSARVSGIVIIEARIEADGTVSRTRVLKSIPLLDEAAQTAVGQWEFTPTLVNGTPTPVIMTVTVNFSLE